MFRVTRSSRRTRLDAAPRPSPVSKLPYEIIREIFKFVVLSSEEARFHGVKTLCLVDRRWNDIANATSVLWTKITLTYPLDDDQLPAVQKRLKTSGSKIIDVVVDLCYPTWYEPGKENWIPPADFLRGVIAALRGSGNRWRSIYVQSNTWDPIREFLQAWVTPSFLHWNRFPSQGSQRLSSHSSPGSPPNGRPCSVVMGLSCRNSER